MGRGRLPRPLGRGRLPQPLGRVGVGSHVCRSGRVWVTHDPVLIQTVAIPSENIIYLKLLQHSGPTKEVKITSLSTSRNSLFYLLRKKYHQYFRYNIFYNNILSCRFLLVIIWIHYLLHYTLLFTIYS